MGGLSHVDGEGKSRMVDVSAKEPTLRTAGATARVRMKPETLALVMDGKVPKGDALGVARVAGIMAAKQVPGLIPMCHTLPISAVSVEFEPEGGDAVRIMTEVKVFERTGVEMEAMTAAAVAALTLYDMVKAVDRGVVIDDLHLASKSGGKSGDFKFKDS
jgi:cyclic pyranopterin phosphate synthase